MVDGDGRLGTGDRRYGTGDRRLGPGVGAIRGTPLLNVENPDIFLSRHSTTSHFKKIPNTALCVFLPLLY